MTSSPFDHQEIEEGRGLGPRGDYVLLDPTHLDTGPRREAPGHHGVRAGVPPGRAHDGARPDPTHRPLRDGRDATSTCARGDQVRGDAGAGPVRGRRMRLRLGPRCEPAGDELLLDIVVFGRRGGDDMARHCEATDLPALPGEARAYLDLLDGILTRQTGDNVADIREAPGLDVRPGVRGPHRGEPHRDGRDGSVRSTSGTSGSRSPTRAPSTTRT